MNNKKSKGFYIAIAHLFYAVSMADKSFAKDEKKSIVTSVREHWNIETEEFDSELVIYETLRELIKEKKSPKTAFEEFKEYYLAFNDYFPTKEKHYLLEASHKICNAQAGKNKSEVIILTKLHLLFNSEKLL